MHKSEFRGLLARGSGRAILYARDHDVSDFRDILLDACLHGLSIEPQSEGTRAVYMLELLDYVPDRQLYCDVVLKALPAGADDWDTVQRFHFAACLAFDGNLEAKRLMYDSYQPGPRNGEAVGIDFPEMDGIDGFLFVADKIGALLQTRPDEVDEGWLWSRSSERFGEQVALDALRAAAGENPRIGAYLASVEAHAAASASRDLERQKIMTLDYEQRKPRLSDIWFFGVSRWGEHASEENAMLAAHGLVQATDPKVQLAHLRLFARRRFPLDCDILLGLATSVHAQVAHAAVRALTQIVHPAVRELALHLIGNHSTARGGAIELIDRNYQPGDHQLLLAWFAAEEDRETLHTFERNLKNFWEHHPDDGTKIQMLLTLYERGPCSFCREGVVQRLLERHALTPEIQAECAYDANEDVRNLVQPTGD